MRVQNISFPALGVRQEPLLSSLLHFVRIDFQAVGINNISEFANGFPTIRLRASLRSSLVSIFFAIFFSYFFLSYKLHYLHCKRFIKTQETRIWFFIKFFYDAIVNSIRKFSYLYRNIPHSFFLDPRWQYLFLHYRCV